MNCPYCKRKVHGWTGLQELQKFDKHLRKCRKNPANIVLSDGNQTVLIHGNQTMNDALNIRAESGQ